MLTAILVVVSIHAAFEVYVHVRHMLPRLQRAELREDARHAVRAVEQRRAHGDNETKARDATQMLLDTHPNLKPRHARRLAEGALKEMKESK